MRDMAIPLRPAILLLPFIALPAHGVQFPGAASALSSEVPAEDDRTPEEVREVAEETEREADRLLQKEEVELPTEPGCFLRTPSGCPNHPSFGSTIWRHDDYAETFTLARELRRECELSRKERMAQWCGSEDVETLFIPATAGAGPAASTGMTSMIRQEPREAPQARMEAAEVDEAEPDPVPPTEPGCYFRKPKGCPSHPQFSGRMWKHAEHAERLINAKRNRTACEVEVRTNLVDWCGTETVEVLFVARVDANGQLLEDKSDEEGDDEGDEEEKEAPLEAAAATTAEPSAADHVGAATAAGPDGQPGASTLREAPPTEPGCFVRKLKGCPNHPQFNGTGWRHAVSAEKTTQARVDRTACEVGVKASMSKYCGTEEVEVIFIPEPAARESQAPGTGGSAGGEAEPQEEVRADQDVGREQAGGAPADLERGSQPQEAADSGESRGAAEGQEAAVPGLAPGDAQAEPAGAQEQVPLMEPGCFVRTPSGCPNHPSFCSADWKHDEYAERYSSSGSNRTECEGSRKIYVAQWCGAEDVETLFVPGGSQAPAQASTPRGSLVSDDARAPPMEPGCFVRTPSGCPRHPTYHSSEWKHEEYSERFTKARANRTMCEVDRKSHVAHWCGTPDVEMAFVPPPKPGCYVSTPTGCPRHPSFGSATWRHEDYGEAHTGAKENRTECEITRRAHVANWCGTADVRMRFVPPDWGNLITVDERFHQHSRLGAPTEPGCFVRLPAGCPNHPTFNSTQWKHEELGEQSAQARQDRAACEVDRKRHVAHWCGTEIVEMLFVAPPEPGCYVRTPSGCPNHPHFGSSSWKHEEYGESSLEAGKSRQVCEVERRKHLVHWCGAEDAEMLFIPAAAA